MKSQKDIEKGCENWFSKDFATCSQQRWKCGKNYVNYGLLLCPTCQALLQQNKEFIEMIDIPKLRKDFELRLERGLKGFNEKDKILFDKLENERRI